MFLPWFLISFWKDNVAQNLSNLSISTGRCNHMQMFLKSKLKFKCWFIEFYASPIFFFSYFLRSFLRLKKLSKVGMSRALEFNPLPTSLTLTWYLARAMVSNNQVYTIILFLYSESRHRLYSVNQNSRPVHYINM